MISLDVAACVQLRGRVSNGVVVLDESRPLPEGIDVQVQPITNQAEVLTSLERNELVARMKFLFDQWDTEDASLTDEEASRLESAMFERRGVGLRTSEVNS
jgi:hypothetical protein